MADKDRGAKAAYRFVDEEGDRAQSQDVPERISLVDASNRWLEEMGNRRKPATVIYYKQRLDVFFPFAQLKEIEFLDQVTPSLVRKFRDGRLKFGVAKNTVRGDETTLKQITKFGAASAQGWLTYDTLRDYDPLPQVRNERGTAQDWELDKVLKEIEHSHSLATMPGSKQKNAAELRFVKARDRMIFLTMIETGARSGEVLSATKRSLLRDKGMIHFMTSGMATTRKNGDDLKVQAQKFWWDELDAYLRIRASFESDDDILFPLTNLGQMSSRQWAHRFATYCKKAGVDGITSHCIRYSVGGKVAEARGEIAARGQLGQRSLQSVERYTRHAGRSEEYLKSVHEDVSPLTTFAEKTGRLNLEPKIKTCTAYRL